MLQEAPDPPPAATMNAINIIAPYRHLDMWVFDDPRVGLSAEPFVGGADTMKGAQGNDTYGVDNTGDHVIEVNGQGIDTVNSTVSFNMGGSEIENLNLLGGAAINGTGNSIANVINGNSGVNVLIGLGGNDTLDGKGGTDTMQGGIGNDTYWVDNAGDHVIEANGQGNDTVNSTVSFNICGSELENLNLRGPASINGTGNSIANVIVGNSGANVLNGLGGHDTLTGAQGNDTFVFNAPASAANSDVITDFAHVAGNTDTIELENAVYTHLAAGDLNAANLAIGHAALGANDYLVYNPDTGNLAYDADGSGAGGTVLIANLANHAALTAADFFVI